MQPITASYKGVRARDFDESCKEEVWKELSWLSSFEGNKAKHVMRLFADRRYGQALSYYACNKF